MIEYYKIIVATLIILAVCGSVVAQDDIGLDPYAKKALDGEELSIETKRECQSMYYNFVFPLKGEKVSEYSDEDNADHYIASVKLAVIYPEKHGGWPFRHAGINKAYKTIKVRLEKDPDNQDLMIGLIIPALKNNDDTLAIETFERLRDKNENWAKYLLDVVKKYCLKNAAAYKFAKVVSENKSGEESEESK